MQAETYNTIIEKSKDKIRKDSSFVRRNYVVLWVAWVIYIFATLASTVSIFTHINLRAGETFLPGIAIVVAGLGTVLVISFQFMLKFFVDDWQAKAHVRGGSEFAMMVLKGAMGVIGIIAGVMLSLGGAEKAVDVVRKQSTIENVPLISVDSISNYYDQRRAEYQRLQTAFMNTKYKGTTVAPALKQGAKFTDILAGVENERAAAIAQADAKNKAALDEYLAETKINQAGAKGFMGFAEFAIVLCIVLIGLFDDGVKKEAKGLGVRADQTF
jgi:hypothetical protein